MSTSDARATRRSPGAHVPALDGLRGLAILLVMTTHFVGTAGGATGTVEVGPIERVLRSGWRGVDLFFVLSGYLITARLLASPAEGYFRRFYVRRSLRIFPLYYAVLALAFVVGLALRPEDWGRFVGWSHPIFHLAYLQNVAAAMNGTWLVSPFGFNLNHFWSLAVEEQFYFAWPLVTRFSARRLLPVVCLAAAWGSLELREWVWSKTPGTTFDVTYLLTPTRLHALALGAFVASVEGWVPWGRLSRALSFAALVVTAGAIVELAVPGSVHPKLPEAMPVALLLAALGGAPGLLASRPLRWFGTYSYGLYVWHQLMQPSWKALFPPASLIAWSGSRTVGIALYALFALAGSVLLSLASWRWLEQPALKWKERLSEAPTPVAV